MKIDLQNITIRGLVEDYLDKAEEGVGALSISTYFDWTKIAASKEARRRRLAALPYIEKLQILNQMRERDLALKNARPSNTKRLGRS